MSPTEESAEAGMRLHTEHATYSLQGLKAHTHTEPAELWGKLRKSSAHIEDMISSHDAYLSAGCEDVKHICPVGVAKTAKSKCVYIR